MGLFSGITDALKDAAPIIGGVVGFGMGGPMGASIGSGIGGLVAGQDVGEALQTAAIGGALGYGASMAGFKPATAGGFLPRYAPTQAAGVGAGVPVNRSTGFEAAQPKEGILSSALDFAKENPIMTGVGGLAALTLLDKEEEEERETRPDPEGRVLEQGYTDPFTGERYSYADEEGRSAIRGSKERLQSPSFSYGRDLPGFISYYEGGGEVEGPGTGTSDSVPARLSDGEFVLTAKAVRGAGGGDRDLGAARMYDMMAELESMG